MLTHSTSLNWLTRHFKAYSCPIVVIEESSQDIYDATFNWYIGEVVQIDNSEIFNDRGIIVLSANASTPEEIIILHEFRHFLQFQINGFWHVPDYENGESLESYNQISFVRRMLGYFNSR